MRIPFPIVPALLVLGCLVTGIAWGAGSTTPIQGPIIGSTVAALPTCNAGSKGKEYMINDATVPAWNTTVVGGGAVVVIVFCNGSNWVVV